MECKDIVSLIFAIVAIIVPIIFLISANNTAKSQLFLQILQEINNSTERLIKARLDWELNKDTDLNELYKAGYKSIQETHLNIYNDACLCCVKKKLDKKLFIATYSNEIKIIINEWGLSEDKLKNNYSNIYTIYKNLQGDNK